MTITYYDKFAFLPKRCELCNRLFIFEEYNYYYREVGMCGETIKIYKCKRCDKNGKKKTALDI